MKRVDINRAPVAELRLLRGIGDTTARRIVANRPYNEPYELVTRGLMPETTYNRNALHLTAGSTATATADPRYHRRSAAVETSVGATPRPVQ